MSLLSNAPTLDDMDLVIAAIVIVVTGVLIAPVRRRAEKPGPKPDFGRVDAVDLNIAERSLVRTSPRSSEMA